jgi:glycosyltransferase involved in cell wall biosynthesis
MRLKQTIAPTSSTPVIVAGDSSQRYRSKVLVVGLFLSAANKDKILRTAADQLAELLDKNGIQTIKTSNKLNQAARFADTMFQLIINARRYKIAIVPLYGGYRSYLWQNATSILLRLLRKKIVLVAHGGSIPMRMQASSKKYLRSFRRAHQVVCPSPFLASVLDKYKMPSIIIENVVNLCEYRFQHKQTFRPRILWMRTLEDIYNPEMAVHVAALLVKKYPGLKMVMAGYDRGSLPMVKQLITHLNLEDHIELPGYISNDQKNVYAAEMDIYICTNRIDNAPVSFIEMMALGLPIVSVSVGGIPYLVKDGVNALLVPLDNATAMADKITSIIEQPELGKSLAANGAAFARQFDEQPVLEKWLRVFHQLDARSFSNTR